MSSLPERFPFYFLPLIFGAALFLFIKWYTFSSQTTTNKLPPSPPTLPVIGNLHQLGGLVHEAFDTLATRYGDPRGLLLIYLGKVPGLIVSSAESAREILKTHDVAFASRPDTKTNRALSYDLKDATMAPYGEHWRQVKGLLTVHLLSNKVVQSFDGLRDKVIAGYVDKINQCFLCNEPANLSDMFLSIANDATCTAGFGRTYNEGEIGRKFKNIIKGVSELLATFYFEDLIPQLAVIDRLRGVSARVDRVFRDLDEFLQGVVDESIAKTNNNPNFGEADGFKSLISALLEIKKEGTLGITIDTQVIKSLLLDAYVAATASTAAILQWAMTELLINPEIMKKAQDEVRSVLKGKENITHGDLEKMTYLKAVIMETTRFHPPIPILIPRVARHSVNVMGYDITKGTMVFVNVYSIMKDPKVWDEPEKFIPERFLDSPLDFVKHNFELIPFGAGRRACPGTTFAMAIDEKVLATFVHKFDWSLPKGVRPEDVDLNSAVGFANHKLIPLLAVGKPVRLH